MYVYDKIGSGVEKFQYHACSAAATAPEASTIRPKDLDGNIDMLIMTAGGNDLCLLQMIKICSMIPLFSEESCNEFISKAEENIDTILKDNLVQVLEALGGKMANDGIVVCNGYAEYFDETTDACEDSEVWHVPKIVSEAGLKLTKARRTKFNSLVGGINRVIKKTIEEAQENVDFKIGFSTGIPGPKIDGQYCRSSSTGYYPNREQPNLQFYKLNTHYEATLHDELRRRELMAATEAMRSESVRRGMQRLRSRSIYESVLYKSPNPRAAALHRLDRRAPKPAGCPGDDDPGILPFPYHRLWDYFGLGAPDSIGKLFHPNLEGHRTIVSFTLAKAVDLRSEVLGVESDSCSVSNAPKLTCWSDKGRKGYAAVDRLDEHYKNFCDTIRPSSGQNEWVGRESFDKGTPDEHEFRVTLARGAGNWNRQDCKDAFDRIINSCDGGNQRVVSLLPCHLNPTNWKYGGELKEGLFTYQINIKRDNRPSLITEPYGTCKGTWYPFEASSVYKLKGAGWSTWDWGQKTLLKHAKSCVGGGLTQWKFKYLDKPDEDGMEWEASFRTAVWVKRYFRNNGAQKAAGGLTDGRGGTD